MFRWLGLIATGLLLTTLALLWLAPTLLPWSQLETRVASVLAERTGAAVNIIELRGELLPSPWLEAARVEIGLQPRVYVEGVRADLQLWPLLRGAIVATSLHIEQLSAEPAQLPALLLREQLSSSGERQRDSALKDVFIEALELYPGQPGWRSHFTRASNGWAFSSRREELALSGLWSPAQARITLQLLSDVERSTLWTWPMEVNVSAEIVSDGLLVDQLELIWPDHQIVAVGAMRLETDQRWQIDQLELRAHGDQIQIAPGVLLNGHATARLSVAGSLDLAAGQGIRLEQLRVQLDTLVGHLSGPGLSALLPPGHDPHGLQVQNMQAVVDWRDQQLSVRRLRLQADTVNLQGYVVLDPQQRLRGELGVFTSPGGGRTWRAGGSLQQPAWERGAIIP